MIKLFYFLGLFIIIELIIIILGAKDSIKDSSIKKNFLNLRKRQSISFRENALKKKFELMAEENVKFSKKYKVETECLQAGFKLSYGEFKIISLACAIVLPLIVILSLNNQIMALICVPIGYFIPNQVISFIKNRRRKVLDEQVGTFIKLSSERYSMQGNFSQAIENCLDDFAGQEPLYSELKMSVAELKLGTPVEEVMQGLARRTGNKFLKRYADFYNITVKLGTEEARNTILGQAYTQYDEHRKMSAKLKKDIAGPINEAYIMVLSIPGIVIYECCTSKSYIDFMTHTTFGKVGSALILTALIGCIWFINAKIASPLDE